MQRSKNTTLWANNNFTVQGLICNHSYSAIMLDLFYSFLLHFFEWLLHSTRLSSARFILICLCLKCLTILPYSKWLLQNSIDHSIYFFNHINAAAKPIYHATRFTVLQWISRIWLGPLEVFSVTFLETSIKNDK